MHKLIIFFLNILPIIALLIAIKAMGLAQRWQSQKQSVLQELIKTGTLVATIHGLRGTICNIADNIIILELDSGKKIEILKQTVTHVINHE